MADGVTGDGVVTELILVHAQGEGGLDACAFLVDGVVERVYQTVYAVLYCLQAAALAYLAVQFGEFVPVFTEPFELNAFGMIEEEYVEDFMDRRQQDFLLVGRKEESVV